jgi:phosphate uptake regulator
MCGFTANLIDIRSLTDRQKINLKKELRRRRKNIQGLLNDIDRALKTVDRKSRRKKSKL